MVKGKKMQGRKVVIETTYTVVGGTDEDARKACCMVAAGITQSDEELLGPWLMNGVAVEPNISRIVSSNEVGDYSDGLKSAVRYIEKG